MNAFTIYNYITKLEKENNKLRDEIEELREAIRFLHSLEPAEDSESVASREDIDSAMTEDDTGTDSDSEEESEAESEESEAESEESEESEAESEIEVTSDHYLPVVTTNTELIRLFRKLAKKEDNEFKKKAYMRAAHVIEDFPTELTSSSEIAHIKGIGKGIKNLIDEYMATGTFAKLRT